MKPWEAVESRGFINRVLQPERSFLGQNMQRKLSVLVEKCQRWDFCGGGGMAKSVPTQVIFPEIMGGQRMCFILQGGSFYRFVFVKK